MPTKISKLTLEQIAHMPEWVDKWMRIGLSCEPADWETAEAGVRGCYAAAKIPTPSVLLRMGSPFGAVMGGILAVLLLRGQVRSQVRSQVWSQVRSQVESQVESQIGEQVESQRLSMVYPAFYGSHAASWLYFYKTFTDLLNIKEGQRLLPLTRLAWNCGWAWLYEDVAILTEKPTEIHMKNGRLHNENGPAVLYEDGFACYALNGVRFQDDMTKFITTPADQLDAAEVLNIRNSEQRAESIKKLGINKLFWKLKPTRLDAADEYELFQIKLYEDVPRIYLKMANPSVEETHIEAVHPDCRTVAQALSWRNFGSATDSFIKPLILT